MSKQAKVITNYDNHNIGEMDEIWTKTKGTWTTESSGVHMNPNFLFIGTTEADYLTAGGNWKTEHGLALTTDARVHKDAARDNLVTFKEKATIITVQMNTQQLGNESKLKTGGFPLAKAGGVVGIMDQPIITGIVAIKGVSGSARLTMTTSQKYCEGTWVRITDVVAATSVESWVKEEHVLEFLELVTAKKYSFEVAYAGTDTTKVWSAKREFVAQ